VGIGISPSGKEGEIVRQIFDSVVVIYNRRQDYRENGMINKIAVIGSGFGGLGAAIRLAAKGYAVDIF